MDTPSNANVHAIVKAQIVFLLSTLTEENFEQNQLQIRTLSEQHGLNIYLHFIRRLIAHSNPRLTNSTAPTTFETSTTLTYRLLVQEMQRLARDPFLADRFREAVDKGEGEIFRTFDLVRFADRLGLRPLERLILAASIAAAGVSNAPAGAAAPAGTGQTQGTAVASATATTGVKRALAEQAATIIRVDFENAVLSLCKHPCFDHADLSPAQAGKLLQNLLSDPPRDAPLLDATQRQALIAAAQTKFGTEVISPILHQLLPTISLPTGTNLVQALNQLGPEITSENEVVLGLLARFGINEQNPPSDEFLVESFSNLSRLAADGSPLCDVGTFVRALSGFRAKLNWSKVVEAFDWPDRHGVDTATLKLLIAILVNSPRDAEKPAVSGFWTNWKNSLYQLRLLDALLSLPSDTFNFVSLPGRRVVTVDDVATASPTIKTLAANVQSHTWNSLDLFEVLVRLGSSENGDVRAFVREMLDKAVRISADIVHMGLLQVPRPWNPLQIEYSRQLLTMFLNGHPNHQLVFMRIWQIEPSYLTSALHAFYEDNPMNITRILDIAQDLKILDSLLDVRPFTFAMDVAALASRREYLNLDKWLLDNVGAHGAEFLRGVIEFLDNKMQNEKIARTIDPQAENRTMALNPATISIFLRILRNHSSMLEEADLDYCIQTRNLCLQIHPRLMNLNPGVEQDLGAAVVTYTSDVEAEVDSIYKQMYDEQITIDQVIQLLQRTKDSASPRDHEIFSCMLHFLFDEYKFFQSFYPPRELAMTGYLFGSLIQHQLVENIPLGIAIRYVLDALQCPPETNLFKFGVQALARFEGRLPEWKLLCEALLAIPHLSEQRPDLAETIRRALSAPMEATTQNAEEQLQAFPSGLATIEAQPVFMAIKADPVEEETFEQPPEETSDKILFIINNLAPSNFDSKLVEMKERYEELYARWLANYLVDQRVSTELNNHQLYLRFLDTLNSKALGKYILHETYSKSAQLLNSEKTKTSLPERNVLKNLGSWLGQITLARDKPIMHKNLSIKNLLIEGAESDRLIVAIPFVCKILEAASKSSVFRPPNPWLMAVLQFLMEIYYFAEIKLNLKFEIEVLCQTLGLDYTVIEPTTILRGRPHLDAAIPDMVHNIDALPIGGYEHADATPSIALGESASDAGRDVGSHIEDILASLVASVTINHQLAPLHTNQSFKRAVQEAVDRSVREIILPVVERSVTIASITTREICIKDFASEPSEEKLRKSAHLSCQKLAGSLALVTCKDPLRQNMPAHVRAYLADHGFSEQMVPEQVVMLIVQDNVDAACEAIEKAAMDRAVREIDAALNQSFEARRQRRAGQPFWDPLVGQSPFINSLPDPLRIRPNGLQPQQLRVYEEFAIDRRRMASRPASAAPFPNAIESLGQTGGYPSAVMAADTQARAGSTFPIQEQFGPLVAKLELLLAENPYPSLHAIPANHDIQACINHILALVVMDNADRAGAPLYISQKLVQQLYKTPSQLGRDIYAAMLKDLCSTFEDVEKEAVNWLIHSEDERKFNVPVTVTLFRAMLITVEDQDNQLARWLIQGNPRQPLQNFAAGLIRECLVLEPPLATQQQFQYTLSALAQIVRANKATDQVVQLLHDLQLPSSHAAGLEPAAAAKTGTEQTQMHLLRSFLQWVAIYQERDHPEKYFLQYITQLHKQGVLKKDSDMSLLFFRVCAEASVNHHTKSIAAGDYNNSYLALDAMSKLVVCIVRYHTDTTSGNNVQAKVHFLTKIVSIVVLVVANKHEQQGSAFQQKPFFRLFSSMLSDFHAMEAELGPTYFFILLSLSDAFSSLQPIYFPGFTFSWLTLISHRLFMPKLLSSENREGWAAYHKLLVALLKFLNPFLRSGNLALSSRNLYRGTLRLLLVLLHDFPDFLSEYYFSLCDAIPARCIQLRNIMLSSYPVTLSLPDPHLQNVKFESIPDMGPIPPILSDFTLALKTADLKTYLDQFLLNRTSPTSLSLLKDRLRSTASNTDEKYNLPLINAVVMYIGVSSVAQAKARSGSVLFVPTDPGVIALSYLAGNLDPEGQYHLMNSMILHLRYPNAHTHWFASLFLHLFSETKEERFREILTRVLLERFIVHRPHPWGALVTFIELLRNPKYDFWNQEFVRAVPEVSMMLENVARNVFQP